jgi:hypothetical protein
VALDVELDEGEGVVPGGRELLDQALEGPEVVVVGAGEDEGRAAPLQRPARLEQLADLLQGEGGAINRQLGGKRALGGRLEDVRHGLADLEREVELGSDERLGAVLEAQGTARQGVHGPRKLDVVLVSG